MYFLDLCANQGIVSEEKLNEANTSIFAKIGQKVVESLQDEQHFPESLTIKIQKLFESGKISDHNEVIKVLQGELDEDSDPRNQ